MAARPCDGGVHRLTAGVEGRRWARLSWDFRQIDMTLALRLGMLETR
jgi:hypothetical protein